MFKNLLLFIFTIFSTATMFSQSSVQWFNKSSTEMNFPKDFVVDNMENQYYTGQFTGTFTIGGQTLTSNGNKDIFILKFDANGNYLWGINIGGIYDDEGHTIAMDHNNHIIVCGSFTDTVDFDPTGTTHQLISDDTGLPFTESNGFILKLSPDGDYQWVKKMGNSHGLSYVKTQVMSNGNIVLAGRCGANADVNPNDTLFSAAGHNGGFILKLDSSANLIWCTMLSGTGGAEITSFTMDNLGTVFYCGTFSGNLNLYPDSMATALPYQDFTDMFYGRLSANGTRKFVRTIVGPGFYDRAVKINIDSQKRIILTGGFGYSVDFDPSPSVNSLVATVSGVESHFIAQYDSVGLFQWAEKFHQGAYAYSSFSPMSINIVENDNILWSAYYSTNPSFNTLVDGNITLSYVGYRGTFITKVSSTGEAIWIRDYTDQAMVEKMIVLPNYHIYTNGMFLNTCDFDIESPFHDETNSLTGAAFFNVRNNYPTLDAKGEDANVADVAVYPNPASEFIYISSSGSELKFYQIQSLDGAVIEYGKNKSLIPVKHLSSGVYIVSGFFDDGKLFHRKFVKQ